MYNKISFSKDQISLPPPFSTAKTVPTTIMSESYAAISILGVMDRLWFHQIILFQEPNSVITSKTLKTAALHSSESFINRGSSSMYSIPEDERLSVTSACLITTPQDDCDKEVENERKERRPARSKVTSRKSRSESSSPASPKHSRNLKYSSSVTRLQKTMSCKSLAELEEEEVKGFIDLGFNFDKDNICPRMMSVLPGLQRLDNGSAKDDDYDDEIDDDDDDDEEHDQHHVLRPYLSEAWLIRRPDSPLLNLRLPRVSTVADMKKHLKYWARTVASEIHQES